MCRGAYKGLLYIKILSFPRGPLSVFFLLPLLHPRVGAYIPHSIRRASLRRVYQTSLKTFVSFLLPPGAVVKKTQRAPQYDCLQHRVLSLLRDRVLPCGRSPVLASRGLECGDVHVHDLDGTCLSRFIRGLYCVERECNQLGASVVRYRYVYTCLHFRFLSLRHLYSLQPFVLNSVSPSRGPLAFFVSFAVSTTSLPPPL